MYKKREELKNMAHLNRIALLLILITLAMSSVAAAAVIPFSGSGANGTIAPGSLQWSMLDGNNNLFRGVSVWGVPGLGDGNQTWPSGFGNLLSLLSLSMGCHRVSLLIRLPIRALPEPTISPASIVVMTA
jgi:hypothetical protein